MRSSANNRCILKSFCLAVGKRTLRTFTSQYNWFRKSRSASSCSAARRQLSLSSFPDIFLSLYRDLSSILGIHLRTGDEVKLASSKPPQ